MEETPAGKGTRYKHSKTKQIMARYDQYKSDEERLGLLRSRSIPAMDWTDIDHWIDEAAPENYQEMRSWINDLAHKDLG